MTTVGLGNRHQRRSNKCVALCGCECVAAGTGDPCLVHIGIPCYCMVVKAYRDVQGIACDAETSEDRGAVLCALHSPRRLSGPVASAQTAQMEIRAVQRAVTFVFDSTCRGIEPRASSECWAVGCCRYFVALVVELEAMRTQQ